jgi:hypothetical protein
VEVLEYIMLSNLCITLLQSCSCASDNWITCHIAWKQSKNSPFYSRTYQKEVTINLLTLFMLLHINQKLTPWCSLCKANAHLVDQNIPHLLMKFELIIAFTLNPVLSQLNTVQLGTPYFFEICLWPCLPNGIFPSGFLS